jgi:3-oxoacyl-[acyl-carrier protein] reductase
MEDQLGNVIVVGASSGIGFEVSLSLLDKGFQVYALTSSRDELLEKMKNSRHPLQGNLHAVQTDLSSAKSRQAAIRELRSSAGTYRNLVFVSAIPYGSRLGMIPAKDVHEVFETNSFAFLDLIQGLVRFFERPASIVVISSNSAGFPQVGNSIYGSSKIALERLALSCALEFRDRGIRVNCIAPTLVETEMMSLMDDTSRLGVLSSAHSLRPLNISEVTNVVLFLLSPDSNAINGEVINLGKNLTELEQGQT